MAQALQAFIDKSLTLPTLSMTVSKKDLTFIRDCVTGWREADEDGWAQLLGRIWTNSNKLSKRGRAGP